MNSLKRIIIAGGRDFPVNTKSLQLALSKLPHKCVLICGGAKGADHLSVLINQLYPDRYPIEMFEANWHPNGKDKPMDRSAGHKRNADMGNTGTHLLAFWDGESRGTKHMINYARFKGLKVKVMRYTLRGK